LGVIGGSKVSTWQVGWRGYSITPVGVFLHAADILDYRALGTFNENHIHGLGLKGMRVWDFGRQTTEKGWNAQDETGEIRLLTHSTDTDYLEQRLGRPASKGYSDPSDDEPVARYPWCSGRRLTSIAGDALVVVDLSIIRR
jgi:hypothetical protein